MKTLHVISHTHWDREWYMPFEKHRLRLVALIDMLLETFDTDPAFRHFHMDGQMIPYEDYLQVRPEKLRDIKRAMAAGKLSLGPWYVLQDEFLTSGEANVRNMMYGLKLARRFGEPLLIGYLPDSFGNLSQMPQILRGFGIDNAVFGRGVNRWNPGAAPAQEMPGLVTSSGSTSVAAPEGYKSEMTWRGPDGSEVLGVFMANWYSNAMDIPSDPQEATAFLARARDNAAAIATTDELLMMNGCDHTPTRQDVGRVLESVQGLLPDRVVHTNFADYLEALRGAVGELQTVTGELRSEYTDGWGTLADTLSARMWLKQANWNCQYQLERLVEPLAAAAWKLGEAYPADQIWHAWATLMQNHPHDSICGCSVDEVHREMMIRFEKARLTAEALRDAAAQAVGNHLAITPAQGETTVMVINPTTGARGGMVDVEVEVAEDVKARGLQAYDSAGNKLPTITTPIEPAWGYQLPDDRFRTPYTCKRFVCMVQVPQVPGAGYETLTLRPTSRAGARELHEFDGVLENEHLKVSLDGHGLLSVVEKQSGAAFHDLNLLEDGGDCGNEYIYRAPEKDRVVTSRKPAYWDVIGASHTDLGALVALRHELEVPLSSDRQKRSPDTALLSVTTRLLLPAGSRRLAVHVLVDNPCTDHRLRALFSTDLQATHCSADGQFDIVSRAIQPWSGWTNPANPQPQQAFVDISDGEKGLCIANCGLPGYEVLRDGRNTIALTLLRCVGEVGDWGTFPTPEAQCLGEHVAQYAIIPHAGSLMDPENCDAARLAWEFASPMWATQVRHWAYPHPERVRPELPARGCFVSLEPAWLALSTIKKAETRQSLIVRFYNPFEQDTVARLAVPGGLSEAWQVNLAEERQGKLKVNDGVVEVGAAAKRIVTVELR